MSKNFIFTLSILACGALMLLTTARSESKTWLPDSSQFSRSRIQIEPNLSLPPQCQAISLNQQFLQELVQNAGSVGVYAAITSRQHQLIFDPSPADILKELRKRVRESNLPTDSRITILVLSDPTEMGCELGVYSEADGALVRAVPAHAISSSSRDLPLAILRLAQTARNASIEQAGLDTQAANNLKTVLITFIAGGLGSVIILIGLTEWNAAREIAASTAAARARFETSKAAWQSRISNLNSKYQRFDEIMPHLRGNGLIENQFKASVNLLGYFAEAGTRRIEEISQKANAPGNRAVDFELLSRELNDDFELQLTQPWYQGSPFDAEEKSIRLTLADYETYTNAVFDSASRCYKSLHGLDESGPLDHLLPPTSAE